MGYFSLRELRLSLFAGVLGLLRLSGDGKGVSFFRSCGSGGNERL